MIDIELNLIDRVKLDKYRIKLDLCIVKLDRYRVKLDR